MDELERCSINGRSGFEVMDFRIEDGTPVCVATWLGESSGAAFRTYKNAFRFAHNRLSKRANRATMLRSNQGQIAREAAERVVFRMIQTSEQSGIPHGEEIDGVVNDVLSDYGLETVSEQLSEDRDVEHGDRDVEHGDRDVEHGDQPDPDQSLGEIFQNGNGGSQ
jgi:hypothetical protein